MKRQDLTNQKFGKWEVLKYVGNSKWLCKCDCGRFGEINATCLKGGQSTQCIQCRHAVVGLKNSTHGKTKTRLHYIWNGMKQRCFNPNNLKYFRYGCRGIVVCDEWQNDFVSFYNWSMQNGYADNLSIDRIDNNGNYCPENCRWATPVEQGSNTSKNRNIKFDGKTQTISAWAKETGIQRKTISHRLSSGWSVKRALTEPAFLGKNQTYTEVSK